MEGKKPDMNSYYSDIILTLLLFESDPFLSHSTSLKQSNKKTCRIHTSEECTEFGRDKSIGWKNKKI